MPKATKRKSAPKPSAAEKDRARRLRWWQDARFGMFIHWGLYSILGRGEWAMNRECIPKAEYEPLADRFDPKPGAPREWARLAKKAGMKYMVLTTKHHEGYCLWDTQQTDFNAVQRGPGRDLVAEYVDACRKEGLGLGFYYSLMDWHHPDGVKCNSDERARRRFVDFTRACVRELMSNYGKVDILWYDVPWPMAKAEQWESAKTNAMVRKLQPDILINNRSVLPEDFGTPEGHITAEKGGRAWEACMTFFKGSWGHMPCAPDDDWHSSRDVIDMLGTCASGGGNLLLNVGPEPDGSVPQEAVERLLPVGKWLSKNGEAIYGRTDPGDLQWYHTGQLIRRGKMLYFLCPRWVGPDLAIGGLPSRLKRAYLLHNGQEIAFEQTGKRLLLTGLPKRNPDRALGMPVVAMEFKSQPRY